MRKIYLLVIILAFAMFRYAPVSMAAVSCGYEVANGQVTYCGEIVLNANAAGFEVITAESSTDYAKDSNHVFYKGVEIKDADPVTFNLIPHTSVPSTAKDANNVYCDGAFLTSDMEKFHLFEDYSPYSMDGSSVYSYCDKLTNSDPVTFTKIVNDFYKDKNNIYYQGSILKADMNSFEVLGGAYAKDSAAVYFRYSVVEGADPVSFKVRPAGDYSDPSTWPCGDVFFDAYDDNSCYGNGMIVGTRTVYSDLNSRQKPYFTDVQKDSLDYFFEKRIMIGYPDGSFGYDKPLSRAELLKIVMVAAAINSGSDNLNCFTDVSSTAWFATYVCAAKDAGMINGYPDGSFKPNDPTNKVEALKMIAEVLKWKMQVNFPDKMVVFKDISANEWYYKYVINGLDLFYIEMNGSKMFDPGNYITRGDAAEILFRTIVSNSMKDGAGFAGNDDLAAAVRDFLANYKSM